MFIVNYYCFSFHLRYHNRSCQNRFPGCLVTRLGEANKWGNDFLSYLIDFIGRLFPFLINRFFDELFRMVQLKLIRDFVFIYFGCLFSGRIIDKHITSLLIIIIKFNVNMQISM